MNRDLILRENLALQRTTLANQTTFLAFLRTSLYFALAGLSLESLLKIKQHQIVEWVLFSISLFIFIYGIVNYVINKRKIEKAYRNVGGFKDEYESKS
jgi:putative membrane protein